MRRFIDMPAWPDEEKFDGQALVLLIERGLAAIDGIMTIAVYDNATGRAVRTNLNNAGRVIDVLPIADVAGREH